MYNYFIEEFFLTIRNTPSNYAYLQACLFPYILSIFEQENDLLKLKNKFEDICSSGDEKRKSGTNIKVLGSL